MPRLLKFKYPAAQIPCTISSFGNNADERIATALANPSIIGALIEGATQHWKLESQLIKLFDPDYVGTAASKLGKCWRFDRRLYFLLPIVI